MQIEAFFFFNKQHCVATVDCLLIHFEKISNLVCYFLSFDMFLDGFGQEYDRKS